MAKAVALLSGGLDSQLAIRLIQKQGITVVGINFASPFFGETKWLQNAVDGLGIDLHTVYFGEEYLELLKNPQYGFGKNLNPCIDCHGLMLNKAGKYMEQIGADFLFTGEVLKQRPKSQTYQALQIVEKLSGYPGLVLRPLSAQLLPPTLPELKGIVRRDQLLAISGRSRKIQIQLAEQWGIKDYPSPAGGCLLTVPSFAKRLKILLAHKPNAGNPDFELLKIGRHLLAEEDFYLIVGRNQEENQRLIHYANAQDILLKAASDPGPTSLLRVNAESIMPSAAISQEKIDLAAGITARYCDAKDQAQVVIKYWSKDAEPEHMRVQPLDPAEVAQLLLSTD